MPDDCSRSRWRADLAIGLLLGVVLGLVVAYAVTIWFWHAPEPLFGPRYRGLAEVFSRVFLVVLIAVTLFWAAATGALAHLRAGPAWQIWLLYALLLGILMAVADPFANIKREPNLIRYATAGMLAGATVFLVAAGRAVQGAGGVRLFLFALGGLFLFGAADEVLQIHEWAGERLQRNSPQEGALEPQDILTLLLALGGFIVAAGLFLGVRFLLRRGGLRPRPASLRAVYLFCGGCAVFLLAMLLDSFDKVLDAQVNAALAVLFETDRTKELLAFLENKWLIRHLSNSVEEVLELTAATLFCAMALVIRDDRRQVTAETARS